MKLNSVFVLIGSTFAQSAAFSDDPVPAPAPPAPPVVQEEKAKDW